MSYFLWNPSCQPSFSGCGQTIVFFSKKSVEDFGKVSASEKQTVGLKFGREIFDQRGCSRITERKKTAVG